MVLASYETVETRCFISVTVGYKVDHVYSKCILISMQNPPAPIHFGVLATALPVFGKVFCCLPTPSDAWLSSLQPPANLFPSVRTQT